MNCVTRRNSSPHRKKWRRSGQLSGGIAHDFNNLLMIVIGNLETVQRHARESNNPNMQRALNNAMRGAQRAASLTQRLLAFSRRQALNPKPLDINKFVVGSAEFLSRSLGEAVEIETVGSAGLWAVEVDANQLEVALLIRDQREGRNAKWRQAHVRSC